MTPDPGEARAEADRSFERLYAGHRGEVYRAALRELGNAADAEDVTQAAFVDAYRALLRGSRPSPPRAWLLAIAENVRRRRFRTALRRPREEPLDAETAVSAELSDERADAVRTALAALPPQQREVFLLREIAGLSYDEIANRLDSTVASVQMLLFRARRTLRALLDPPPITRRRGALGLQLPPWLVQLVGRGDPLAFTLTPRGAGALGAAVLAVTGIAAVAPQGRLGDEPRPVPAVVRDEPAREQTRPVSVPAAPAATPAKTLLSVAPAKATAVSRKPVAPARTPPPTVVQVVAPEPAPTPATSSARPTAPAPPSAVAPSAVAPPVVAPPVVAPPTTIAAPVVRAAAPVVPPLAPTFPPPPAVVPAVPAVPPIPVPPVPPVVLASVPLEPPPVVLEPPTPPLP